MPAQFKWKSSYLGSVWYDVSDETGRYTAELRHEASAYALSIANGDQVRRDMLASINLLVREYGACESRIPDSTIAAFNQWRIDERDKAFASMSAQPEKYGPASELKDYFKPIIPVCAGQYIIGHGWKRFPLHGAESIAA